MALGARIVQPFQTGPVAFDGAASVLYFDRIVSGERLETFVNTTPKPLLTLVYGMLHALTGDWRSISWATIAAFGMAVTLGTILAWRVAKPIAAVAAAILIADTGNLLVQVSWAHGLPWALALWFLAGIALTADRPAYLLAGVALMLGALARHETFLLLAATTAALGWLAIRRGPWRAARWCLVGWLALPIMLIHDLALTGDPLYWARVASIYAEGQAVRSLARVGEMVPDLMASDPIITLLAVAGLVWLVHRRHWIVAIGIATIAVGTTALLLVLAARHLHVLFAYLHPIELALRYAAAFGIAGLIAVAGSIARSAAPLARITERRSTARALPGVGVAIALAALVGGLHGPLAGVVPDAVRWQLDIDLHADRAAAVLADHLHGLDLEGAAAARDPTAGPDPSLIRILVPRVVQSRLAVDLDLSIAMVGPIVPDRLAPFLLRAGQLVYHDRLADPPTDLARSLEADGPTTVEGIDLVPLLIDRDAGMWIWRTSGTASGGTP